MQLRGCTKFLHLRRTVGVGRFAAALAGKRGGKGALRAKADAQEVALVAQDAPPAAHAFAPSSGLRGLERFATDQRAAPDGGEQQLSLSH